MTTDLLLSSHLKPSFAQWLSLASVTIENLRNMTKCYADNRLTGMSIGERHRKASYLASVSARLSALLATYHSAPEQNKNPIENSSNANSDGKQSFVNAFIHHMRALLERLPALSSDMQILMNCDWREPKNKEASALFHGYEKKINSNTDANAEAGYLPSWIIGIGSGLASDGYLPELILDMVRREAAGNVRETPDQQDEALLTKQGEPEVSSPRSLIEEWRRTNRAALCSAGRIN